MNMSSVSEESISRKLGNDRVR